MPTKAYEFIFEIRLFCCTVPKVRNEFDVKLVCYSDKKQNVSVAPSSN